MPSPAPTNKTWPKYELRGELPRLRSADDINDRLTAACANDPHLVFLGAVPRDTGLPGWGGEIRVDYRSSLEQTEAARAMADVVAREVGELDSYANTLADFGSEVAGKTAEEVKAIAPEVASYSKWIMATLVIVTIAALIPTAKQRARPAPEAA